MLARIKDDGSPGIGGQSRGYGIDDWPFRRFTRTDYAASRHRCHVLPGAEMTAVTEDLFRFVAIRDPQRTTRSRLVRAFAFDPAENTAFHARLRSFSGDPDRLRDVADAFMASNDRWVPLIDRAPEVIADVDRALLLMEEDRTRGGDDFLAIAIGPLRRLAGGDSDGSVLDLLGDGRVHEQWSKAADSFLAVTFGSRARTQDVVEIGRVLVLWGLLEALARQPGVQSAQLDEMVRDAVVVIPGDIIFGAEAATPVVSPVTSGQDIATSPALAAYGRLVQAGADVRRVLRGADGRDAASDEAAPVIFREPVGDVTATAPDVVGQALAGAAAWLQPSTRSLLAEVAGPAESPSLLTGLEQLDAAADRALSEYAGTLEYANRDSYKRAAIAGELLRRRPGVGIEVDRPFTVDVTLQPAPVSDVRLLSPPVLGDLKVVRQTLAGYELGEIAHVENVLEGEKKVRRHQVVDVTELESIESERREEESQHELQTTTRSELASESQSTIQRDESFNAGGTITASYGPYFSASATVGVAQSKSQSESAKASTRFAQDITDRASDALRTATERVRRSLTRNTIMEENTHTLKGAAGNTVGVYRWVNKHYCMQVYNYGLRVLLDIGVSDPSANYRYAAGLGANLDVDADPPPPLLFPGTQSPLTPQTIGSSNWQTLAAMFRVGDFPTPPPFWITTPFAWSEESAPPQQAAPTTGSGSPSSGQTTQPPAQPPNPRLFKSSREITIPGGYLPLRFVACVLVDGPAGSYSNSFSDNERAIIRLLIRNASSRPPSASERGRLDTLIDLWLTWDSGVTPRPAIDFTDVQLLNTYAVPALGSGPPGQGLQAFIASASGGFRPGLELAVGPTLAWAAPGARKVSGSFYHGQTLQPPELVTTEADGSLLPVAASTGGGQGFAVTMEVLSAIDTAEQRWQYEAYNAILAARAAWETEWRSAVAQAETRAGVAITGRNPQENAEIILTELKRQVIAMLGAPAPAQLDAVTPGRTQATGNPPRPVPPSVNFERAGEAARLVAFYEQAFEWQNMSYIFYPYFWSGRDDWTEAMLREDPDPLFAQFLKAGSARVVLPTRPGFERLVGSRLHLKLPSPALPASAPQSSDGPYLDIAEEIRAAQDATLGGSPSGKPWPVVLPTTLVALDGTPMPTYRTPCDPPPRPLADSGAGDAPEEPGDDGPL